MFRPSEEVQREWDQRLKDSGFNDVDPGDSKVIQPVVLNTETEQYLGGLGYYHFCQRILEKHSFKEDGNKEVFRLKNLGYSIREIQRRLETKYGFTRRHITRIIEGLDKDVDRTIFTLHSEGLSEREIQAELLTEEQFHVSEGSIHNTIVRIRKQHGLNL